VNSHIQVINGLNSGTLYNFRVRSKDSAGNLSLSNNYTFTTSVNLPAAPANLSPADRTTGTPLTQSLAWSASANAASYNVYFGTSATPPLVTNINATSYAPGALTANTTYYWRIVAQNNAGSSSSATISFTTGNVPAVPAGLNPASGATGTSLTPTLSWSAAGGASSYDVYFGTSSTPPLVTNTTSLSYAPSLLSANTVYYWRVIAKNNFGNSSSIITSFTTAGDTTPPSISDVSVASITASSALISWTTNEACDTQVEYGASLSYGSMTVLNTSMVNTHSQIVGGLNPGTVYNFRVRSKDSAGNLSISNNAIFTTSGTLPGAPTNLIPDSNSTGIPINQVLSWTPGANATSHDVYFGTNATPPLITTITASSYAPAALTADTVYYWRVVARNAFGITSSATKSFTTIGLSLSAPTNLNPAEGTTGGKSVRQPTEW
jgi:hypothetical protein